MIAKHIKNFDKEFTGDAALYELDEPMKYDGGETCYVIVSATVVLITGPETYICPADCEGNIINWGELEGSYRGGLDHVRALEGAGYTVE